MTDESKERVNTDRYYTNQYLHIPDLSKVLTLPTKTNILTEANKLLKRFEKDLIKLECSIDYGSDYSVYTGTTGVVALYWLIASLNLSQDSDSVNQVEAKRFMEKRLEKQQESLARIERILPKLKRKRMSFLAGDAGPLSMAVIIYHEANETEKAKFYWKKLLELGNMVFEKDGSTPICNEILYGRAGYLYSLLLVRKLVSQYNDDTITKRVVDRLIDEGRTDRTDSDGVLYYEWHDKCYLGAAHGISGIMYILLKAHSFLDSAQITYVRKTVDWLLGQCFSSGNLRSSLGSKDDKLVHWCHGAPGAIYMFLEAYKLFGDNQYLNAAIQSADVIWKRGVLKKSYSLCHGVAGNAYAFMATYEQTKDEKYLEQAFIFVQWCFDYGTASTATPDRPLSLFEGLAGVIYMLFDFAGSSPKFPAFQL
ncbi:lanC-like protein 2 [Bradysia coprophila]|uniref:lanC-like protein 2 n=1 Tax=Bradysia coprophila TaxID=38358 RepID=UPI00187D96D1|nr:lanC-like protein 2 [Bradysia coprophila]